MHTKSTTSLLALLIFAGSLFSAPLRADVLVLVHGYLSVGHTWRDSGIAAALVHNGWRDAGLLTPVGIPPQVKAVKSANTFYTAELPSEAPLLLQADQLAAYLLEVQKLHGSERLIVTGHSAGGVVTRAAMVRHAALRVDTLITIAAPHLGTDKAELGLAAGNSPLAWIAPFIGADTINRSQHLYADLVREAPGTLLFWLNRQPHPEAEYISVVREGESSFFGSTAVPPYSQHLELVPALRGRAHSIPSAAGHGLHPLDGGLLLQLLAQKKPTSI